MAPPSKGKGIRQRLVLDNLIGSQPELGPAPPDGGYGWVILFGVMMIQLTIPSILVTSGLLICHIQNVSMSISLHEAQWIWLPTVYCAAWSLADPWSVTMTSVVNGCCMAVTGILLVSSAVLAASLMKTNVNIIYISVGLVAGIGASMATTQSEYLLRTYFSSRLPLVRTLHQVGQAGGEMLMPVVIGSLLTEFGLSSTLLLQAGITLQALIGAVLFRRPRYKYTTQTNTAYTLLQTEDTEERINTEDTQVNIVHNQENSKEISNELLSHESPSDICDRTAVHTSENFNLSSSPATDNIPQPLFTDVELPGSYRNTAFFIEDSDDDTDLYVQRGGFTKRTLPCSEEIKVLRYPLFYCGLILTAVTKMSVLSFWILLPLLLKSRLRDFQFYQAVLLISIGGAASFCSAIGSHWLPVMSARQRKCIFVISSYIAAGGLYMAGDSSSWAFLVCACVLLRLGTSGVTITLQQELKDTMGNSEVIKIHTLLHIFTGLLVVLGMMMILSNIATSFKILAGIQLGAGSLWCLQSLFRKFCNNCY